MAFLTIANEAPFRKLLADIFTDEFMQKHTNFQTFEGFKYSSAVITNWDADIMIYSEDLLNLFVRESTEFDSWNKMVIAAVDEKKGDMNNG